ncbi:MAG: hypothetical protein PHZ09_04795 [Eubacteriales bacterium]|jgi:SAM-dependent methyltransferase|nr:hypothetical protein [Eubacteriales bacterium]
MPKYLLLSNPGHNRVYFDASKHLSVAELEAMSSSFSVPCRDFAAEEIEGVCYITFLSGEPLAKSDLRLISRLSFVYAVFEETRRDDEVLLRPMRRTASEYFNDDISTILKYTGKTNEIFTRLLINLAVAAGGYAREDGLFLLDPVAGKGTTLFEALILGYNCAGVEIAPSAVTEGTAYLKRYLKTGRYKHKYERTRLSGEHKSFTSEINSFTIARDKESMKAGDTLDLQFIAGNSLYADHYFKKGKFHVIAGDLPYGVQHGNVSNEKQSSLTRNPAELLRHCLPVWKKCLRPGGAAAFAWNINVFPREEMEGIFISEGFKPQKAPYDNLRHRVDASITRDIIVCLKNPSNS